MNIRLIRIIKNFSYTLTSNFISLAISTLVVMIVPKLIGVEEYGYWQLYLFYISYVGFLHFGWTDGIYLREGGKEYNGLDHKNLFSQFYMLLAMQIIIGLLIIGVSIIADDRNKLFIISATAICMIITNMRSFPFFLLQATNRIKDYARSNIVGQISYFLFISAILLFGVRDFKVLIIADLGGRLISLIYSMVLCKEITLRPIFDFKLTINDTIKNISAGSKLMFSYIASLLIIGVVRFGIERAWDVATFGKVSLTLSISKLVMLFISSISIILFPLLRKTESKRLPAIYSSMRDILIPLLFGAMIFYYPIKVVLSLWLPDYSESLIYMALLFPMIVFEGKTSLLLNTFLKTLRKERILMTTNIISLVISIIATIFTTILIKKIEFAIVSIVIILAIRSIVAEVFISKELGVKIFRDNLFEVMLTISFIFINWNIDNIYSFILYLAVFIFYLIIKYKDIKYSISVIKIITAIR